MQAAAAATWRQRGSVGARYAKREDSVRQTETQQERIHEYVWHVAHDLATIIVVSTL